MSTIIIYGWSKWKYLIGIDGIVAAGKLINEFDSDPVENVSHLDVGPLSRSLKIIMSPRLIGLDQYCGAVGAVVVVADNMPFKDEVVQKEKDNQEIGNLQEYNNWVNLLTTRAEISYYSKTY